MSLATNKNLEELFDLPAGRENDNDSDPDVDAETHNDIQTNLPVLPDTLVALDKIEAALPQVRGLEASDEEMDDLAGRAKESFDDLMNLGMQVDSRYASEIFAVASTMLGHAITAKTAKMNKKLKMIQLQLQKAKMDQTNQDAPQPADGTGRVLNRNDLLRTILSAEREKPAQDK
jgi:hypothetical protein